MATELRRTDAVDVARERRSDLREALLAVEAALAAPEPGRTAAWADAVRAALRRLEDAFDAHVLGVEAPDGLFEDVIARAPRLANQVRRLADEHDVIAAAVQRTLALLDADQVDAEAVRDAAVEVLSRMAKHRQHGADLVYEAYAVDIGGSD
ncbi:MAG TPA: hypothetical protein VIK95_10405 [Egibacteraceae bacterium]